MKRWGILPAFLSAFTMGMAGSRQAVAGPPDFNAEQGLSSVALGPTQHRAVGKAGGVVRSFDAQRGVPSFVWAVSKRSSATIASPRMAALAHAARFADAYGLSTGALETLRVIHTHDTGRDGIVVRLRHEIGGIEVFHSDLRVMMKRNRDLVALSGRMHPQATLALATAPFTLALDDALASAFEDLFAVPVLNTSFIESRIDGRYTRFALLPGSKADKAGLELTRPARVKPVFFPLGEQLVAGYFVELYAGKRGTRDAAYHRYVIAADDGRVLYRENLTYGDSFDYRVWAAGDVLHTPLDGPQQDYTPHPTGTPDSSQPAFVAPTLVTMEGFNTNPVNAVDPWLPASATESVGNNVDAYTDHSGPDGFTAGDLRATVTSPQAFDRTYDVLAPPLDSDDQSMASVTQLFYVNNWLHDWFYDSGFDEAAGNAQNDNLGRGGEEGDALRAEAQDGALGNDRNNANMSTPADGESPRMQMYLWTTGAIRTLDLSPAGLSPATAGANFGPPSYDVTATMTLAEDGQGDTNDGCQPLTNNVTGDIVLIDRSGCSFVQKVNNAQSAGAVGVVIANDETTNIFDMGGNGPGITIPAMMISLADGNAFKSALGNGPQTAHMVRATDVERDGTIDNTIVGHEWGHYIHNRLVDGGNRQHSAMSEGWADFFGIYMGHKETDDLSGAYAVGVYATFSTSADSGYFGIRRYPYSTDPAKNALSFRHISNGEDLPSVPGDPGGANSQVHNAGEVWASMLWDGYLALVARSQGANAPYDFMGARRRMADYVVAGLKMTPETATYTEGRDGVLAAAFAADIDDGMALAQAFAGRGAGSCAESPARFSTSLQGLTESNDLAPVIDVMNVTIDDSVFSCDQDGILDGGEVGLLTVEVANTGIANLDNAQLSASTDLPGVVFTNGPQLTLGTITPFDTATATVEVRLDGETVVDLSTLDVEVTVTATTACEGTVTNGLSTRVHADDNVMSSATDTVESTVEAWAKEGDFGAEVWEREAVSAEDHRWHGEDRGSISDTWLESPDLVVDAAADFVLTFGHIYDFEVSDNTLWDGGVVEISNDGGTTWTDVDQFDDPGYDGPLTDQADNPLSFREAYSGQNPSYPAPDVVTLDFGQAFAGDTVRVRFRIGTDQAVGAPGWFIDDIAFSGITNLPFGTLEPEAGDECQQAPIADAGPDLVVSPGDLVGLDASSSSDPEGDTLAFTWSQSAGMPRVSLSDEGEIISTFVAPDVEEDTTLTFTVAVSDGTATSTDDVEVAVRVDGGTGGSGGGAGEAITPFAVDSGCGCHVAGHTPAERYAGLGFGLVGLVLLGRRRRRK